MLFPRWAIIHTLFFPADKFCDFSKDGPSACNELLLYGEQIVVPNTSLWGPPTHGCLWFNGDVINKRRHKYTNEYHIILLNFLFTITPWLFALPSCSHDSKHNLFPSISMLHWHVMHILLVPDPPAKYWACLSGNILCVYDCNPGINGPASWLDLTRIYGAWGPTWLGIWQYKIRKYQVWRCYSSDLIRRVMQCTVTIWASVTLYYQIEWKELLQL